MLQDRFKVTGNLTITLYDKDNNVKDYREIKNLIVTSGKVLMAQLLAGEVVDIPSHMALGTDNTAAEISQTTLLAEVGRASFAASATQSSTITFSSTFRAGVATGALTEAGIFNAAVGGTMLCRTVFSTITKNASDTLTVNWNVAIN